LHQIQSQFHFDFAFVKWKNDELPFLAEGSQARGIVICNQLGDYDEDDTYLYLIVITIKSGIWQGMRTESGC
jgi:hypothetical protein